MDRLTEDDLKGLNLPDPDVADIVFLDKNGNPTQKEDQAVVKLVTTSGKTNHFVKYARGELVDPHHTDSRQYLTQKLFKFRKVDAKTYERYEKFLKTKNTLYYTQARRLLMRSS